MKTVFKFNNTVVAGFFVLLLIFFLLRLFDELKDWRDDLVNFPERPLSQGVLNINSVRYMSVFTIACAVVLNLVCIEAMKFDVFYLIAWAWLMRVEFYCSSFLRRHIFIYLFTHHLVMVLSEVYIIRLFCIVNGIDFDFRFLVITLVFTGYTLILELSRKIWDMKYEKDSYQTYSKAVGLGNSVYLVIVISLIAFFTNLFLLFMYFTPVIFYVAGSFFCIIQTVFLLMAFHFKKQSFKLSHYHFKGVGAIYVLASLLVISSLNLL